MKKVNFFEKLIKKPFHKNSNLALISGNLAETYKAGISINQGIELISSSIESKAYKKSLNNILIDIKNGMTLSESCSKYEDLYGSFFTGMIAIGENSGKLYEVLQGLSKYYKRCEFIRREIVNAGIYPLFIMICFIALILAAINIIIPDFYELYKSLNIAMPQSSMFLYKISEIFRENTLKSYVFFICYMILIPLFLFKYFKDSIKGEIFMKIKIFKQVSEYMLVLILEIITSCGMNISYGLNYAEKNINSKLIKNNIYTINRGIKNGETLSDCLKELSICSPYTASIIKIREESGNIEEGFHELSKTLNEKLDKKIKFYVKLIEPLLILIMSLVIMIFLIIFCIPLFTSLTNGMKI